MDRARTGRGGRFRASWRASRAGGYRLRVKFSGDRHNVAVSRTLRGRMYVYRLGAASWYGPGFYGGRTACGQTLTASIKGAAHKSLPCARASTPLPRPDDRRPGDRPRPLRGRPRVGPGACDQAGTRFRLDWHGLVHPLVVL